MEEKIIQFAKENNLLFGITTAEPFSYLQPILEKKFVPFVDKDIERRIDPRLTRSTCESIIVLGLSYNKKFLGKTDDKFRGRMSLGAIGTDYHIILKEKFQNLREVLQIEGDIFVDTGPLVDREVAKRAGVGVLGKSTNIISSIFGTWFFIGYMLIDEKLENISNNTLGDEDICGDCQLCYKACPNKALSDDGINYDKCISYLTQLKQLTDVQKTMLNGQIYGCDICQKVCPYNKDVFIESYEQSSLNLFYPDIFEILNITNKEFRETYEKSACGWRGKKVLQRNALLALLKKGNKEEAIKILNNFLHFEKREDMRECAFFVLDRLKR